MAGGGISTPTSPVAEREGFEPSFPCGKHALQACALGQTTRPLQEKIAAGFSPQRRALYHKGNFGLILYKYIRLEGHSAIFGSHFIDI